MTSLYHHTKKWFLHVAVLVSLFFFSSSDLLSQELKEKYNRPGLTILFVSYDNSSINGTASHSLFKNATEGHGNYIPDRFYNNQICDYILKVPTQFKDSTARFKSNYYRNILNENNVGKLIINYWFDYTPEKGFEMTRLFDRAEYNANDEEYIISKTSKRGEALIRDFGNQLIQYSYILVIDMHKINTEKIEKTDDKKKIPNVSWTSVSDYYLYKVDFSSDHSHEIFDCWQDENDPVEVKTKKISTYKELTFDVEPICQSSEMRNSYLQSENILTTKRPTDAESLNELMLSAFSSVEEKINKRNNIFKVESNISKAYPIKSKIGAKEGLHVDHRYFVYEYVWNEKLETALPIRKGVIRAKKVADNRIKSKGETPESTFYQIYGLRLHDGMQIQEHRDVGLSLQLGYKSGSIGGVALRSSMRIGQFTKVPALYIHLNGTFGAKEYSFMGHDKEKFNFNRFTIGIGKGIHFLSFFEVEPFIGLGTEVCNIDSKKFSYGGDYYVMSYDLGINGKISLLYNLQVYSQLSLENFLGAADKSKDSDFNEKKYNWSQLFINPETNVGRTGGTHFELGIRFEF